MKTQEEVVVKEEVAVERGKEKKKRKMKQRHDNLEDLHRDIKGHIDAKVEKFDFIRSPANKGSELPSDITFPYLPWAARLTMIPTGSRCPLCDAKKRFPPPQGFKEGNTLAEDATFVRRLVKAQAKK